MAAGVVVLSSTLCDMRKSTVVVIQQEIHGKAWQ